MEKHEIQTLIDSIGITYKAEFVPQSKSRTAGEKPCLNWKITIGKGNQSFVTDYMQGIGHLKNYNFVESNKLWYSNAVKHAVESGKWNAKLTFDTQSTWNAAWKPIPQPELIDVLYCLVQDADVINYSSFEEWAEEFGYDIDSRQAEKTYRECLDIALKLRGMLGNGTLEQLQNAFQDY